MKLQLVDDGRAIDIATTDEELNIVNSALHYYAANQMGSQYRNRQERERRWHASKAMATMMEHFEGFPVFYSSDDDRGTKDA